jgi:hypothetical protein
MVAVADKTIDSLWSTDEYYIFAYCYVGVIASYAESLRFYGKFIHISVLAYVHPFLIKILLYR